MERRTFLNIGTIAFGSMLIYDDHLQILVNQTDPVSGAVGVHAVNVSFTGGNAAWQIVPGAKRRADILQQRGPNDATAPPDARDAFQITVILVFDGGRRQQRQTLRVYGDYCGEKRPPHLRDQ